MCEEEGVCAGGCEEVGVHGTGEEDSFFSDQGIYFQKARLLFRQKMK